MVSWPDPPGKLSKVGKDYYHSICEYLAKNDLLQDIDVTLVFQASVWWEIYLKSLKGIGKNGTTVEYSTGHRNISPDVSNLKQAQTCLDKLLDKLGIGERARQQLKIMEAQEANDPMNNL